MRLLPAMFLAIIAANCDDSSSSLNPTRVSRSDSLTSGAVITGRVNGIGLTASTIDETGSTTLRVTVAGTNLWTMARASKSQARAPMTAR